MAHIASIGAGVYSDLSIAAPASDYTATQLSGFTTANTWQTIFSDEITSGLSGISNGYVRLANVREFPSIGAPANIVNVASYGSKASKQINGQADAPTIEITVNFIAADWDASTKLLATFLNDGKNHPFRFSLLNSASLNYSKGGDAITTSAATTSSATVTYASVPVSVEVGQELWNAALTVKYGTIISTAATTVVLDTIVASIPITTATVTKGIGQVQNSQWFFYGKVESLLINPQLTDANTATLTLSVASDFYGPYTL